MDLDFDDILEVMAVGMVLDDGYDSVNKNLGSNKQQQVSANKKKEKEIK